jgi:MinD-like ATPase involved in chromosome partitioning or flagellar assembly
VVNKVPPQLEPEAIAIKVEQIFDCEVAAVLPHCHEMLTLASEGIFSIHYPEHELTTLFKQIAEKIED